MQDEETDRRDHFIPVARRAIVARLVAEAGEPDGARIAAVAGRLALLFHLEVFARREALKDGYAPFNPDQPGAAPLPDSPEDRAAFLALLDGTLERANFRCLDAGEVTARRDSAGRVQARVRVPEGVFADVRFHARGWHRREITVRRWFGLRREAVEAALYHDVVLIASVRRDAEARALRGTRLRPGAIYLKLFRDIPEADLQTLYPNARVVMGPVDQLVIAVPAVVGGVPILLNLLPALSVLLLVAGAWLGVAGTVEEDAMKQALGALSGLGALGGFLLRQWVKYERQKLKYQKQVSDNAYFNNLGNNAAFFDVLIGASEESEVKEAILAWTLLARDGPVDRFGLDVRIEAWLRARFEVDVDFEIDDALAKLRRLGLIGDGASGLVATPPAEALARLDAAWARAAEEAPMPPS